MIAKKIFLVSFVLMALVNYKNIPVLAQQNEEIDEIKKVVENYLDGINKQDIDSIMNNTSQKFSIRDTDEKVIDQFSVRSHVERMLRSVSDKYADYINSDLEITKSELKNNEASLEIKFNWKGFNLTTLKEDSGVFGRKVLLVKEDGAWKIAKWDVKPVKSK